MRPVRVGRAFNAVTTRGLIVVGVLACDSNRSIAGPGSACDATAGSPLIGIPGAGVLLDVDLGGRRVSVIPASKGFGAGTALRPSFSLLQSDVIDIHVSNYRSQDIEGLGRKIHVIFDVSLHNRLDAVALLPPNLHIGALAPTFLMLFPVLAQADLVSGGAGPADGGVVTVETPSPAPTVEPGIEWDGTGLPGSTAGYDFGADTLCTASAPNCSRWKAFPPLNPDEASPAHTVGFDLGSDVARFKVLLVLAANLSSDSLPQLNARVADKHLSVAVGRDEALCRQ